MLSTRRLVAGLAAVTVLLTAACSSEDAATPTPSASVAVTATSAASSSTASSSTESSAGSSSAVSSSTAQSVVASSIRSSAEAEPPSAVDPTLAETSTESTRILGAETDTLDEQSIAWMTGMCDAIVPLVSLTDEIEGATDPTTIGASVTALGRGLIDNAGALGELPAPTFEGGQELATAMVTGLTTIGEQFLLAGDQIADNNPEAATTIAEAMESNPFDALQGAQLNPAFRAQIAALPACAALEN